VDRSVGFPGSKSDALTGRLPADAKRWLYSALADRLQTAPLRRLSALGFVVYLALFCVSVYAMSVSFPTPVRITAAAIVLASCMTMRWVWQALLMAIRPVITVTGENNDPWKTAQIANANNLSKRAVPFIIVALTALGVGGLTAPMMLIAGIFCLSLNAAFPHIIIAWTLSAGTTLVPPHSAGRAVG
jgi:hypothetical protein